VHGAQLGHAARLVAAPTTPVVARSPLQEWFAALLPVLAVQSMVCVNNFDTTRARI
jgi:hypothetical protein